MIIHNRKHGANTLDTFIRTLLARVEQLLQELPDDSGLDGSFYDHFVRQLNEVNGN